MYYSAATNGAYDDPENYKSPPSDLKKLTEEIYVEMFINRPPGKMVTPGSNGFPMLVDQPLPSDEVIASHARDERDRLLREVYDICIIRLAREDRLGSDVSASLAALDAYAVALLDVPQQLGFPTTINWPDIPYA